MNWVRRNWNSDIEFRSDQYFEPAHSADATDGLAQLVHVAEKATREQAGLKAIGAGWAFEDIAQSDDWTVSLAKLNRQLHGVVDGPAPALTGDWVTVLADPASPGGWCTSRRGSASSISASSSTVSVSRCPPSVATAASRWLA